MGTKKREPWCLILERHSGGNSNLTSPNLVYITLSCLKHKIFTVYDIFDLLEHNGKGKNKYKSYLGTLNSNFPPLRLSDLSTRVLIFVYPFFRGTGTPWCTFKKVFCIFRGPARAAQMAEGASSSLFCRRFNIQFYKVSKSSCNILHSP